MECKNPQKVENKNDKILYKKFINKISLNLIILN